MSEEQYLREIPFSHRKKWAQFFTPEIVVKLMSEWILGNAPHSILDPAFGLGAFYKGIRQYNTEAHIVGYEIDPLILSRVDSEIKEDPRLKLRNQDYLEAPCDFYDSILCNPPYFRFQKFKNRHTLLPKLQKDWGIEIPGSTNLASIFLRKSLAQLNQGGRLAYIMPYEFLNSGYGQPLKRFLIQENLLKSIIFFENEKEIFPEAITTICVLLCQRPWNLDSIRISIVNSRKELNSMNSFEELEFCWIEKARLDSSKKWSPLLEEIHAKIVVPEGFCAFSEYGSFKRGIATGANEFFALSAKKIKELQIPRRYVKPCITKSRQLQRPILETPDLEQLIKDNVDVFCLNAKEPLNSATKRYLAAGETKGLNQRFLTRNRTPWYKLETRTHAPLWLGVFSRERIKVIRNYTECIHFTCYHSFYPNALGMQVLDKLFLYLISDFGQQILKKNRRRYGDGLDKFEPNDFNQCLVPSPVLLELLDVHEVEKTLQSMKRDPDRAVVLANEFIHFWAKHLL